jgi:hypothetical protein
MATPGTGGSLIDRMRGAAMLNVATYEEVEADTTATGQAAIVVVIVAICSAIGAIGSPGPGIIAAPIAAVVAWLLWAGVTYVIGDKLLGGTATWGELLRTLGFAQAPGVLLVLGIIPLLGRVVVFAVSIWTLVTGIIAIRQALDFSTGKAVVTAVLSWIVVAIVVAVLGVGAFRP